MKPSVISLHHVTKRYPIHHEKPTLVEHLYAPSHLKFINAVNNLKISVSRGDKLGIIGPNGSGKTTLLKLICGITQPTSGQINVRGKLVSLIDLSAGFHPDMTGYENIFINGLLLGMSRTQIKHKLKDIIAIADINTYLDVPLYTYSDGMKLRLGFAIAINTEPDILVLDEHLSVGDYDFQQKADRLLKQAYKRGLTSIIASHDISYLRRICSHCLWLNHGHAQAYGLAPKTIKLYLNSKSF